MTLGDEAAPAAGGLQATNDYSGMAARLTHTEMKQDGLMREFQAMRGDLQTVIARMGQGGAPNGSSPPPGSH